MRAVVAWRRTARCPGARPEVPILRGAPDRVRWVVVALVTPVLRAASHEATAAVRHASAVEGAAGVGAAVCAGINCGTSRTSCARRTSSAGSPNLTCLPGGAARAGRPRAVGGTD